MVLRFKVTAVQFLQPRFGQLLTSDHLRRVLVILDNSRLHIYIVLLGVERTYIILLWSLQYLCKESIIISMLQLVH